MDGSDTSLIEISVEDDSLLSSPLLRNATASAPNGASPPSSSFACSPLVRFPGPPHSSSHHRLPPLPRGGDGEDLCKPGSSSSASKDNAGKENVDANKLEASKLGLEPQQMKRKKKGGGFNLRKSLAWNRAFFTEEGVLDPLELSMLNGNLGSSTGLSTIQEGRESLCSGLDGADTSPSLQVLEDNLFKELPVNSVIEGRKLAGVLSPKPGSATRDKLGSASAAKRKVFPSPDANKSASKRGGYPQPMASSSLRKQLNWSMTKLVNKGSKISTLFTSRPDATVASVSQSHPVAASRLKKNQTAKPVTIQKSAGGKITAANVKASQGNVKCGPSSNSDRKPIVQSKQNVIRSESSTNARHHVANQTADKEAKVSDALLHPAACPLNVADIGVLKTVNSSAQNAGNMQHTRPLVPKPSGLRMPSPSLGFFGQSKTSGSQSLPRRTQLCSLQQSGIPTLTSAVALKPTQLRPPLPRKGLDQLRKGCSVASIANPVLLGKAKCNTQSNVIQNPEVDVLFNSKSVKSNPPVHNVNSNAELQNLGEGEPCNSENVLEMEDQMPSSESQNSITKQSNPVLDDTEGVIITDVLQRNIELTSNHPRLTPHLGLEVETEVQSETQTMASSQEVDPLFHSQTTETHTISLEIQSGTVSCDIDKDASTVPANHSCGMHDENKQLQEQAEMKPFVYTDSTELRVLKSLKAANGNRAHELENPPDCLSCCIGVEEIKDGAEGTDYLIKKMHVGDAKIQAIDFVAPFESGKNGLHTLDDSTTPSLLDDTSERKAEKSEFRCSSCVVRPTSLCDHTSSSNIHLLSEKGSSSEESMDNDITQSVRLVPNTFAHGGGLTDCGSASSVASFERDSGLGMAVEVHQIHGGNAVKDNVVEASSHDIELQGDSGPKLLDCEGQVMHAISSCPVQLTDVCLNTEHSMEGDWGDTNYASEFKPVLPVEIASKVDYGDEHELFLDQQVNCNNSQPGNSCCYSESVASMVSSSDCSIETWNKDKQSLEEAQRQGSNDNLASEELKSVGDSERTIMENSTDFAKTCEIRWGNSCYTSQIVIKKHEDNHAEENMAKEKGIRDSQLQPFDVRSNVDFDISKSVMNSNSKMVVDDSIESFGEHLKPQMIDLAGEVTVMCHDMLSDDSSSSMDISSDESEDASVYAVSEIQPNILSSSDCSNGLVTGHLSFKNHRMHLDDNLACTDSSPREALLSDGCADAVPDIQMPPAVQNIDLDRDKNASYQHMDAEIMDFSKLGPSTESGACSEVCGSENGTECREHDVSLELNSSLKQPGALIQLDEQNRTYNVPCSFSREVALVKSNAISNGSQQGEAHPPKINILLLGTDTRMIQNGNSQMQHETDSAMRAEEDKDAASKIGRPEKDEKKDAVIIKPPPDAVPFSDEWLAAFEAAGEEILTMKSGAVQNSPPDKPISEPGPWSPVRRKNNQDIGPFDCTKFTKTNVPRSAGS